MCITDSSIECGELAIAASYTDPLADNRPGRDVALFFVG
jgi:hypothetical protein